MVQKHIKHLKRHRNVLYGIIVVLLALQIISFISTSSQFSKISAQQGVIKSDIDKYVSDLEGKIGDTNNEIVSVRQENQFEITAITQELTKQKDDIQSEINLLKSSDGDFSGVIENVIASVVNVRTDRSTGTGFVLENDGLIVTNNHVIQDGAFVQIQTFDGNVYDAEVIGVDSFTDLALLNVFGNFESLELASSDDVQIGEKVIAIGNPLGLSFTVTEGIVSAKDREGPNGLKAYVQTDVTLNPGNSGGPLINKEGEVIGINNFKVGGAGVEGLGFALESDKVAEIVDLILGAVSE